MYFYQPGLLSVAASIRASSVSSDDVVLANICLQWSTGLWYLFLHQQQQGLSIRPVNRQQVGVHGVTIDVWAIRKFDMCDKCKAVHFHFMLPHWRAQGIATDEEVHPFCKGVGPVEVREVLDIQLKHLHMGAQALEEMFGHVVELLAARNKRGCRFYLPCRDRCVMHISL